MAEPKRRFTDNLDDDIEAMIINEDDPKQRAFLIVLNSINKSLVANTATIKNVSDKLETHLQHFEDHAREEEALMNKGRGMWIIAAWVIGIAQIVGMGAWKLASDDLTAIKNTISSNQIKIAEVLSRVASLEGRK